MTEVVWCTGIFIFSWLRHVRAA